MKKLLSALCILFLLCISAHAAENFETDWNEYIHSGDIVFDPSGTTLNVTASDPDDDESWGNYTKYSNGAVGAVGTFNVISESGEYKQIGLRKYVARNSAGNRILAEFYLESYNNGTHDLYYRVRERQGDTATNVQRLAQGVFGEWTGSWSTEEDIKLGLWYKDGVLYFSCSKFPDELIQIKLPSIASDLDTSMEIVTYTEDGSIEGTISDLNIGYSLSQMNVLAGIADSFTVYLPHITSNATWTDYLQADNSSAYDATYTLELYNSAGESVYSQEHTVSAKSEEVILPKTLSSEARCGKITYDDDKLFFRLSYAHANGGVAEFKLTDNLNDNLGFYFTSLTNIAQWKGIALTNFGSSDAEVTMYAEGSGSILGTATATISANSKLVGIHTSWFPGVDTDDIKRIVVVSSSNTLSGIVICGTTDNSSLLFTSGAEVTDYTPTLP